MAETRSWRLRHFVVCAAVLGCAGPNPGEIDVDRGERALAAGNAEDAADAFRSALVYRPGDVEALHGLTRSQLARGDGEAALGVLSELERVDRAYFRGRAAGEHRLALYQAARTRLAKGNPSGSLRLLRRLRALDPGYPGLAELMAEALIAEAGRLQVAGRGGEARLLLSEVAGGELSQDELVPTLAELLLETGRVDTAITVLSDALLRRPGDPRLQRLIDRALEIRYPDLP